MADRAAEFEGATDTVALPERHLSGLARGRGDNHLVSRDLLDAPGCGPEHERLARACFVDHLFVQLAHARPADSEEYAVQPAVRDRPGVHDGDRLRVPAGREHVRRPIPEDARLEVGELIRGILPGEHAEHALQHISRQRRKVVCPAHERLDLVDSPVVHRAHRHDLLCQHVERVLRDVRLFD